MGGKIQKAKTPRISQIPRIEPRAIREIRGVFFSLNKVPAKFTLLRASANPCPL
jgi:hypothetical protein